MSKVPFELPDIASRVAATLEIPQRFQNNCPLEIFPVSINFAYISYMLNIHNLSTAKNGMIVVSIRSSR